MNSSSTHVKYKNPPIQEAVCEIRPVFITPLDKEKLAKIGEVFASNFPAQQIVDEKTVSLEIGLEGAKTSEAITGSKLVARSVDQKDIFQVTSASIIVNRIAPYEGWNEVFRDRIYSQIEQFRTVLNFNTITRIGLRYINKIELPVDNVTWKEWFTVTPPSPPPLTGKETHSFSNTMFKLEEGMRAVVNFGTFPHQVPGSRAVLLDIDVIWEGLASVDDIKSMLDNVHRPHNVFFESYLKDSLRDRFGPQ